MLEMRYARESSVQVVALVGARFHSGGHGASAAGAA